MIPCGPWVRWRPGRAATHAFARAGLEHVDGLLHEIADHRFDVAAVIANFRVTRGFNFDEGGAGKQRETARDFSLADASRSDHQDILGCHFVANGGVELSAAPAIAQSDRNGLFSIGLTDDVTIKFRYNLARREGCGIGTENGQIFGIAHARSF